MALKPGARLGPYEIAAPIGAGGMGEVYRAVDTRLDRAVAIKILPEHLAGSPERRDRFQREARAISSLNHPKICTLHDVGEEGGVHYLVLEHLEGETLAQRIQGGPIPAAEALHIAAEIADALDAAHRRGLVHRDLKPGNVMLTASGLKLLDFGLARALQGPPADPSNAPTTTTPVTAIGTIVGTLQYMAPEQVEGKEADARADLFALGVILYEMITGRPAFQGETQSALIASILKEDPPPLPATLPSVGHVERCLRRCLARDREERWQSARDLMHELRWLAEARPEAVEAAVAGSPGSMRWPAGVLASLALLAGLGIGWLAFRAGDAGATAPLHADLALPEGTRLNGWGSPVVALAPDGRAVAFVADGEDGMSRLYVRQLDSAEAVVVPDSETAEGPFFSPDGRWVGFAVGVSMRTGRSGELLKYSLDTGLTQSICPLQDYFGGVWGSDDEILFNELPSGGLVKVPASGGEPRTVLGTYRENGEDVSRWLAAPTLLPDGRHVLLTEWDFLGSRIVLVDLETGELTDPGIQGERAFFAGGHLLYTDRDGTLFELPFDAGRRVATGTPVARMDGIALTRFDLPVFDISGDGSQVYARGYVRGSRIIPAELVHVDTAGSATVLPFDPQLIYREIAVSPAGDRLASFLRDGSLWIYDVDRGTRVRLPSGPLLNPWSLSWSPDGKRIAFSAVSGKDGFGVFHQAANGTGEPEALVEEDGVEFYFGSWAPDGRQLVYVRNELEMNQICSIRIQALDTGAEPAIVVDGLANVLRANLSPDGRWLAYDSAEGGIFEVYVHDMSGASERIAVSPGGGEYPRWSPDSRTLYYHAAGRVMGVSVPDDPGGRFGRPRPIVETDIEPAFVVDPKGGFYGYRPVPGVGIQEHLKLILGGGRRPGA